MSAAKPVIPYQGQSDPHSNRTCGAACLSMVYQSFGKQVPQDEIWPAIARRNQFGSLASTTHLMAADALGRGFNAVALQVRRPLDALRRCAESGVRAIVNHRVRPDSKAGHYSVLAAIDDDYVVLHDPLIGPSHRLKHADFLALWTPLADGSEILGDVLIAVAAGPDTIAVCSACHAPLPWTVDCPRCGKSVGLQPVSLVGCINDACASRLWNYIICPACDYTWSFSLQTPEQSDLPAKEDEDPWKLKQVFSRLDAFCAHVMSVPGAAANPDIKRQLDFMMSSKDKLKQAQIDHMANRQFRQDQLTAMLAAARQRQHAHQQKMDELNTPSSPLDGNALALALLRNLGFID